MDRLFSAPAFADFGPCALSSALPTPPVKWIHGSRPAGLRSHVRQECPRRPGVYGMMNGHGELIYVGKGKSLRARLLSYFRPRSRDAKAGRILKHTCSIVWEYSPSEFAALHRELELIRRWRPRFNVQGQPAAHRQTYVCLGRRPAPYVFLTRRPPRETLAIFGPVSAGEHARQAVRRVNDWFRLRDCSQAQEMVFANQGELFPMIRSAGCLRHEIGTCLGPCAAACTQEQYTARVWAARAFLAGTDSAPLTTLEGDMNSAAAAQEYERAAALRDRLEALRWLFNQLEQTRCLQREASFIYPVRVQDGGSLWYLIHQGRTVAALAPPQDPAGWRSAASLLETVYFRQDSSSLLENGDQRDSVLLVAAWFRRYPEERARTWKPSELLDRCRKAAPESNFS